MSPQLFIRGHWCSHLQSHPETVRNSFFLTRKVTQQSQIIFTTTFHTFFRLLSHFNVVYVQIKLAVILFCTNETYLSTVCIHHFFTAHKTF